MNLPLPRHHRRQQFVKHLIDLLRREPLCRSGRQTARDFEGPRGRDIGFPQRLADPIGPTLAPPQPWGAAHPDAARLWLSFIRSPKTLSIFECYGFRPFTKAVSAG
jgi:hypothetical protein